MVGEVSGQAPPPPSFCDPFLDSLTASRVAIATLRAPFDVETVCASDRHAAHLSELQLDLGQGPCWEALTAVAPVCVLSAARAKDPASPTLYRALSDVGVFAVYSFPLLIGIRVVGAVDLFFDDQPSLAALDVDRAIELASAASVLVVVDAMERRRAIEGHDYDEGPFSRRDVHQATGMVIAQLNIPAEEALLLIRARAFTEGVPVRELAAQIINREVSFRVDE